MRVFFRSPACRLAQNPSASQLAVAPARRPGARAREPRRVARLRRPRSSMWAGSKPPTRQAHSALGGAPRQRPGKGNFAGREEFDSNALVLKVEFPALLRVRSVKAQAVQLRELALEALSTGFDWEADFAGPRFLRPA